MKKFTIQTVNCQGLSSQSLRVGRECISEILKNVEKSITERQNAKIQSANKVLDFTNSNVVLSQFEGDKEGLENMKVIEEEQRPQFKDISKMGESITIEKLIIKQKQSQKQLKCTKRTSKRKNPDRRSTIKKSSMMNSNNDKGKNSLKLTKEGNLKQIKQLRELKQLQSNKENVCLPNIRERQIDRQIDNLRERMLNLEKQKKRQDNTSEKKSFSRKVSIKLNKMPQYTPPCQIVAEIRNEGENFCHNLDINSIRESLGAEKRIVNYRQKMLTLPHQKQDPEQSYDKYLKKQSTDKNVSLKKKVLALPPIK